MRLNIVLIDHSEEDVHDLLLDVQPHSHKLTIYTVQYGFEVVTLTWILTIKKLQEAAYKVM